MATSMNWRDAVYDADDRMPPQTRMAAKLDEYEAEIARLNREIQLAKMQNAPPGWRVTRVGNRLRFEEMDRHEAMRDKMGNL